jgi:hypothetical protein
MQATSQPVGRELASSHDVPPSVRLQASEQSINGPAQRALQANYGLRSRVSGAYSPAPVPAVAALTCAPG